ncbi:MAG: class I SAM-dependent DNA methyltransferase [Ruminococcus sp.]
MESYNDFAEFYDSLMINAEYKKRAEYILKLFNKLNHNMGLTLDLACGTGNLTLELAKAGVDIYGIDGSEEMLSQAINKSAQQGLNILFLCQKMQEIDLYGTIDTCVCTLDSINHMTDIKDVQKTFDRVSLFMNKGGYFLFDLNTIYKHREILCNNIFVYDTEDVYCVWQNSLKENNLVEIDLDFFIPEDEVYFRASEHFEERAYSDEEITAMLNKAGFEKIALYGEMTFDSPKDTEQRVIYVAQKI